MHTCIIPLFWAILVQKYEIWCLKDIVSFFGDLIIKFVLEKLIDNLFTSHHIFTFLSSELTVFSRAFR